LYKVFKKEFIGESFNSKNCEIQNPWVAEFKEKSTTNNVSAFTTEPIIIINRSLGYQITYYLEEFTYYNGNLRFYGFTIFDTLETENEEEKQKWEYNRNLTYTGSILHFFNSLVNNRCFQEGFSVYRIDHRYSFNSDYVEVSPELTDPDLRSMIRKIPKDDDVYYLIRFDDNIEVRYYLRNNTEIDEDDALVHFSRLKMIKPQIRCTQTGWVNMLDFEVAGYWANQRTADLLPYEYIQ
jgi:hypothetical protein